MQLCNRDSHYLWKWFTLSVGKRLSLSKRTRKNINKNSQDQKTKVEDEPRCNKRIKIEKSFGPDYFDLFAGRWTL